MSFQNPETFIYYQFLTMLCISCCIVCFESCTMVFSIVWDDIYNRFLVLCHLYTINLKHLCASLVVSCT
ncbi:hypothetical protein HanIR_Chr04g0191101 [Helianthus annuus]|nr:hypothetical protein HanIR_Chr04g0191101 [Helianthus annuus]